MHELSIAIAIIEVASEEAQRRSLAGKEERPVAVHVRVGELSGVVASALENAFELARAGTLFEGCRLVVGPVSITAYCRACAGVQPVESVQHLVCARCGAEAGEIVSGRELDVVALEFIDEPYHASC